MNTLQEVDYDPVPMSTFVVCIHFDDHIKNTITNEEEWEMCMQFGTAKIMEITKKLNSKYINQIESFHDVVHGLFITFRCRLDSPTDNDIISKLNEFIKETNGKVGKHTCTNTDEIMYVWDCYNYTNPAVQC